MRTINKFDADGNFIFWEDPISGTDTVRRGFMPGKLVMALIDWVTVMHKPLEHFPHSEVDREQWGAILAEHTRLVKLKER